MEVVLKTLQERIEQIIKAHENAKAHGAELKGTIESLEATVSKLESRLEEGEGHADRAQELEQQKTEFAERLETVISMIDKALESQSSSDEA